MIGEPIRPELSDGMQRFSSVQRFLVGVFVSVIAGTLVGAAMTITGFSSASVMLWSGVVLTIISGIVLSIISSRIVLSIIGGIVGAWRFLAPSWRQSRTAATHGTRYRAHSPRAVGLRD